MGDTECPTSRALDFIAKMERENPRLAFWINTGRWPSEDELKKIADADRPTSGDTHGN